MLLFVLSPTTITDPPDDPPGSGGPLTSASNQRLAYLGLCGFGHSLPAASGSVGGDLKPYMDFCGLEGTTVLPDGTVSLDDQYQFLGILQPSGTGGITTDVARGMFVGLVVPLADPPTPITHASVERLRWMDFCGTDMTTMRPDGAISLADQYHFTGLIQGLLAEGETDDDRLLLLGVS